MLLGDGGRFMCAIVRDDSFHVFSDFEEEPEIEDIF